MFEKLKSYVSKIVSTLRLLIWNACRMKLKLNSSKENCNKMAIDFVTNRLLLLIFFLFYKLFVVAASDTDDLTDYTLLEETQRGDVTRTLL